MGLGRRSVGLQDGVACPRVYDALEGEKRLLAEVDDVRRWRLQPLHQPTSVHAHPGCTATVRRFFDRT